MEHQPSATLKRFNYLTAEINAAYHEAALLLGLSDSAMMVLYTICDSGGRCQLGEILRLTGVSKQTINSALRKLEAQGTVYLEASGGRKKTVCLTESGKALAERTVARLIEVENDIFAAWTQEDREQYLALTQRYLNDFKEKTKESLGG